MTDTSTLPTRAPRWLVAALAIAVFVAVDSIGLTIFKAVAGDWTGWARIGGLGLFGYGLYLLIPALLAAALFGPRKTFAALGLDRSPLVGFGVAAVFTAVVLIGYAVVYPLKITAGTPTELMRDAVLPVVAEELLYRALLFGFLFRFAGWGFLPSALLGAVVFGAAHLYQGGSPTEALMIAALTALGGLWFSWLYAEWRFNLWVPIGCHAMLNGYWTIFEIGDNALGTGLSVGLRLAAIVVSVVLTVMVARRRGGLVVSGRRWWAGA